MIVASKKRMKPNRIAYTAVLFGIAVLIVAISPTLIVAAIAMVIVGIFSISFSASANATLQNASSLEMRGRVMALWMVAFQGSTPIGGPVIGWVGQHIDPRWSLGVGGIAAIIAGVYGLIKSRL